MTIYHTNNEDEKPGLVHIDQLLEQPIQRTSLGHAILKPQPDYQKREELYQRHFLDLR
tara:strand:- start:48 stop:221 length:174 start_codon:yes stop_codon:yes gene_type:complete